MTLELNCAEIEWLGKVPASWDIRRLKDVSSITPSNVDKKSYDGQDQILLCNYTDVYYNDCITDQIDFMAATASEDEISKFGLQAGQVIITKDSETADDIGIAAFVPVTLPGVVCGYHLSIIECTSSADGRFVKRLFDSTYVKSMLAVRANGLTRVGLGQAALSSLPIPVPPVDQQRQIADYLDVQTAKIDALIGKQEQLIETLAERRQAVISHAVTKGLDPSVPMKDSGVDWLGEYPEHWSVPRVGHNFSIVLGKMVNASKEDQPGTDPVPYLRAGNVQPFGIDISEIKMMSMTRVEREQLALLVGDLVVVEGGQGGYGRSALVIEDLTGWAFQNHVMRVRPKTADLNAFLDYVVKALRSVGYIASLSSHASLPSFSSEKLAAIRYGRPPVFEQVEIVRYLNHETTKIDALSAKAREMIDVLKERRQALISAAVTGKIDVRDLV